MALIRVQHMEQMQLQKVEKILLVIIKTGLYATLAMPFIVTEFTLFPFVFGKAIFFQIIIEIALIFWVALLLLYPQYRPWFYKVEKTRSGNVAKKRYNWLNIAILAWLMGFLLATLFSVNPTRSFWGTQERMTGVFTILHFGLYYFMLISVMRSWKEWRRFLWGVVAAGMGVVGHMVYQGVNGGFLRFTMTAEFGNPGYVGSFLYFYPFVLLLLIWQYIYRDEKFLVSAKFRLFKIIVSVLIEIIFFAAIVYNATRATWVGLFVALVFGLFAISFFIKKTSRLIRAGVIVIACICVLLGILTVFGKLPVSLYEKSNVLAVARSITRNVENNSRIMSWKQGLQGFTHRFVFGYGPENFNVPFNRYYDPALIDVAGWYRERLDFDKAHNEFVEHIVTTGIIGSVSYGMLFIVVLFLLWKKRRQEKNAIVLMGILVGYIVMMQFTFDTPATYLLLIISFGLTYFTVQREDEKDAISLDVNNTYALITVPTVLVLVTISIALFNIRPLFASGNTAIARVVAEQEEVSLDTIFGYYYKALGYNTPYNHEIVRYMAMDVLGTLDTFNPKDKSMIVYTIEWLDKYSTGDWFLEMMIGRAYGLLCDADTRNCNTALEHLDTAVKLAPTRYQIYSSKINVYLKLEKYKEARDALERALTLGFSLPNTLAVHIQVGFMYAQTEENDKALQQYEAALIFDEKNIEVLQSIALIAKAQGNIKKAQETAQKMLEIDPGLEEQVKNFLEELEGA